MRGKGVRGESEGKTDPTDKAGTTPPQPRAPLACCLFPIARHLPHYCLHFTACCPLSAAILFVRTILRLAEIAAQPQVLLTQSERRPGGSVLFWKQQLLGRDMIPWRQTGKITQFNCICSIIVEICVLFTDQSELHLLPKFKLYFLYQVGSFDVRYILRMAMKHLFSPFAEQHHKWTLLSSNILLCAAVRKESEAAVFAQCSSVT